ncbi:MAG: hypothetical protein JXR20_10750 [Balneola sp.]
MKNIYLLLLIAFLFISKLNGQDRSFKDVELSLVHDIVLSESDIFKVHSLEINELGDIVFFDFGKSKLVRTNVNGVRFKFFGNGKGRGPKEFVQIMDVKISNEKIFLSDREKGRIIVWNLNGEFEKEVKSGGKFIRPSRIAICDNLNKNVYLSSAQYGPNGIFHLYDHDLTLVRSFKKIESKNERLPYFTDGNLNCDGNGNLYYASRYLNSIQSFNNLGKLRFDVPVYGFEPNKKIIEKKGRRTSPAKGIRRASGDIYIIGENLLVAYSNSKYIESKLIDVYDNNNGRYKYSINVPEKFTEFTISNDHIVFFVLDKQRETHLKIYSYDKSNLE